MSGIIVAPTEPPQLRAIASGVSIAPERLGVDVMFTSEPWGVVGIQRKAVSDLVASVADGRLAKEVAQMQRLALAVLVVEGRPRWTVDGQIIDSFVKWTRVQHKNLLRSVQAKGIWVEHTDTIQDTIDTVLTLKDWCDKGRHNSLDRRPKPGGAWGAATERDYALFLMQSFEGVGPEMAGRIVDHFGGVPMDWTVPLEELKQVPGVGPKRAEAMFRALRRVEGGPSTSVAKAVAKKVVKKKTTTTATATKRRKVS